MESISFAKSIIHPTDFSELSQQAFAHALALALRNRAKFTMLHVAGEKTASGVDWSEFPGVRSTLERWGLLQAGSSTQDVAAQAGVEVAKIAVFNKSPLGPIVDAIHQRDADFLVLATHGREGIPRWLHPSVAEPAARMAKIPTLFVSRISKGFIRQDSGDLAIKRILLPIDFSPHPRPAFNAAAQLAGVAGAGEPVEVSLLHIGKSKMPEFVVPAADNVRWQWRQAQGDPVETIVSRAETADLVIMATQGHQGFLDALRGSTTEQVLRRAPCPLLAVPVIA